MATESACRNILPPLCPVTCFVPSFVSTSTKMAYRDKDVSRRSRTSSACSSTHPKRAKHFSALQLQGSNIQERTKGDSRQRFHDYAQWQCRGYTRSIFTTRKSFSLPRQRVLLRAGRPVVRMGERECFLSGPGWRRCRTKKMGCVLNCDWIRAAAWKRKDVIRARNQYGNLVFSYFAWTL